MSKNLFRIVEAYAIVLSEVSGAIIYLLYLSAALFAGMLTELLMAVFKLSTPVIILVILVFGASFTVASLSVMIISRISVTLELFKAQGKRVKPETEYISMLFWVFAFLFSSVISNVVIPAELVALRIAVMVSLGVSLGNMATFLWEFRATRRIDPRPLFVCLYLLLTLPSYLLLPEEFYPYIINSIHLTFSYFVTAVWYILSARQKALGILHAARGEN
ncbi:MAG: hypothetical protein QW304_05540 [Thermoproteota archaeon]